MRNGFSKPSILVNHQYNLVYKGHFRDYYGRWCKERGLILLTLGIYYFWAREQRRTYKYAHTYFFGMPFAYQGDGLAAFKSAAPLLFARLGILGAGIALVYSSPHWWAQVVAIGCALLLPLGSWARARAFRYEFSRLRWGTQAFQIQLVDWRYVVTDMLGLLVAVASLGLLLPFYGNEKFGILVRSLTCGELKFRFTGKGQDLWEDYISAYPAIVLSGGLAYWWLHSKIWRYRIAHVWIGGDAIGTARGFYGVKGRDYLHLTMVRWLANIASLGFLRPLLETEETYYKLQRFAFVGHLNLHTALDDFDDISAA